MGGLSPGRGGAASADRRQERVSREKQTCVNYTTEAWKMRVPWRSSERAAAHALTVYLRLFLLKVAVTLFACVKATVQDPFPVHAPLQPINVANLVGFAFRVTTAPLGRLKLHAVPQLIPLGFELTWPKSVAVLLTVSVTVCRPNVALTFWA